LSSLKIPIFYTPHTNSMITVWLRSLHAFVCDKLLFLVRIVIVVIVDVSIQITHFTGNSIT